jgi:hypothetical protein
MEKTKVRLSLFDRYVIYRDEHWVGRDLVLREAAEELLARQNPAFVGEEWKNRAVVNWMIATIRRFERIIARRGIRNERVDTMRGPDEDVVIHHEDAIDDDSGELPARPQHVQAEIETMTADEWIRRFEKLKREVGGQQRELKRLWGVMKATLPPPDRKKVEKYFRNDQVLQKLMDIEGIEDE